ncbi:ABC transporter permease subunit [Thermomonospora umbrina]|uniref:ABC-2 family transporter n=1 Tax=Thermomonospora umbrina TaxID=111806 RepID=A0A3D9SQT1_9ACTN|nr:ABC transporter permease subunit [Thermomonospora umbrina]REE96333.1 ABC-2 family transporter [Thermomonospora umbrina]
MIDGFGRSVRAEWTKFRTVRGWVIAMGTAAVLTVLLSAFAATGNTSSCTGPNGQACPAIPLGPGGEAVKDGFAFAHRGLTGDGEITVRLTSMTGVITYPPPDHDKIVPGLVPWAKAGIIVKDGTRPGSSYAAVMLTGRNGVRMQHDFTEDTAGRPGGVSPASPRWLRLTRSGDTLTGYESSDGARWTEVGKARLEGLPDTVRIGLFATSPGDLTVRSIGVGAMTSEMRFTQTSAVFDNVTLRGSTSAGAWRQDQVGGRDGPGPDWERDHRAPGLVESGGRLTVTGSGDIAPISGEGGLGVERALAGVILGMVVVAVVGALFITAEHRRGLYRTTLLATPGPGRVLAAKAVVLGAVAFVVGLAGTAGSLVWGKRILVSNGNFILPAGTLTEVRVIVGTAALLAVTAVLALGLGALFRRGVTAVLLAVVTVVLPYVLAVSALLPAGPADWVLRLSPASAFAIQQSIPEYPQVVGDYRPAAGYFPLSPWAGFAVLCCWAALVLGLAAFRMRRRDA